MLSYISIAVLLLLAAVAARQPDPIVKDTDLPVRKILQLNYEFHPILKDLMHMEFFRYFKLDLQKECRFWEENSMCHSEQCAVTTLDEQVAEEDEWKIGDLGAVEAVLKSSPFLEKCDYSEADFCVMEDEKSINGDYVDLVQNPERYTGYAGDSAARVWKAIYEQNCFKFIYDSDSEMDTALTGLVEPDNLCLEKRAFYRVISGLHSSISIHLCHEYYYKEESRWGANLECYQERVGEHTERLENLYFLYTLMMEAISRLDQYLDLYTYCTGNKMENMRTRILLKQFMDKITKHRPYASFDSMFYGDLELKESFKNHFRNVSRIMDCVGCDKCRLWGKLQVSGIGTALKILFSFDPKIHARDLVGGMSLNPQSSVRFKRNEIVSLFNGFFKLSSSLQDTQEFAKMEAETRSERQFPKKHIKRIHKIMDQFARNIIGLYGKWTGKKGEVSPRDLLSTAIFTFFSLLLVRWILVRFTKNWISREKKKAQ